MSVAVAHSGRVIELNWQRSRIRCSPRSDYLRFFVNHGMGMPLGNLGVFGFRQRHVFLSFPNGYVAHVVLEAGRGKDCHALYGRSFPMLETETHVPAGMNTVAPACASLTESPNCTRAVPVCRKEDFVGSGVLVGTISPPGARNDTSLLT
jgi:hypothetical protein